MKFIKGQVPWNKGKTGIYSPQTKEKMSLSQMGHGVSEETRKKMSEHNRKAMLGKHHSSLIKYKMSIAKIGKKISEEHKKKLSIVLVGNKRALGYKHTEETKKKMSLSRIGDKHWNWLGGISFNPYPQEFNSTLKLKIRTRDNFTCCLCGRTEREELEELNRVLCVNHIDFDKNNCQESNLNTLCLRCNVKINREREYWANYFNQNN